MQMRVSLLGLLLVLGFALAGCSGGGGDETASDSSSSTSSSTTTNPPEVVTITRTTTISGVPTTVTSTVTKTTSSSGETTQTGPTPDVSNVTVTPGSNSAVVVWEVSGGSGAVTSRTEYSYQGMQDFNNSGGLQNGVGPQSTTISNLASCNDYQVRIAASDTAGTMVRTNPVLFTTTAGPTLAASAVSVPISTVIDTRFTVQWTVAGPSDAKSHVEYGTTAALGSAAAEQMGIGAKSSVISGLAAGQTYNYKIILESPCGTAASPLFQQKTATIQHVDITNGAAAASPGAGAVNSFAPGSTLSGALTVKVGAPLVFDVTNKDSVQHEFHLTDSAGANISPSYSSGNIAAANTYHFPIGVSFGAVGTYHMKCIHHAGMTGDIDVEL